MRTSTLRANLACMGAVIIGSFGCSTANDSKLSEDPIQSIAKKEEDKVASPQPAITTPTAITAPSQEEVEQALINLLSDDYHKREHAEQTLTRGEKIAYDGLNGFINSSTASLGLEFNVRAKRILNALERPVILEYSDIQENAYKQFSKHPEVNNLRNITERVYKALSPRCKAIIALQYSLLAEVELKQIEAGNKALLNKDSPDDFETGSRKSNKIMEAYNPKIAEINDRILNLYTAALTQSGFTVTSEPATPDSGEERKYTIETSGTDGLKLKAFLIQDRKRRQLILLNQTSDDLFATPLKFPSINLAEGFKARENKFGIEVMPLTPSGQKIETLNGNIHFSFRAIVPIDESPHFVIDEYTIHPIKWPKRTNHDSKTNTLLDWELISYKLFEATGNQEFFRIKKAQVEKEIIDKAKRISQEKD